MSSNNNKSWLDIIVIAMEELGGHARYIDLYTKIEEMGLKDINAVKDYKAQVRGTIERHSSDSEVFHTTKSKKDIFYSVGGKGGGHWGLRGFEPHDNAVDITEDDESFPEGKKKLRIHICRERNYRVIKTAKDNYYKKYGKFTCQICGFDFVERYGSIGNGFIEAHHTIPVSELNDGDETKLEDIILVCSNCHRMLHRRRPWLKVSELHELLK